MPLRVTKHRNREHHVNLFLLYDDGAKKDNTENPPTDATTEEPAEETEVENEPKYHYTLVRSLPALLRQDTHATGTMHVCPYCLHIFYHNEKGYQTHLIDCKIHKPQVIELPDPDDVKKNNVSFRNVFKSFPVQFCLYVDFECFLGESDGTRKNVQQIHEVSGFCMLRVSTEPTLNKCKPYLYSGENVMEEFYRHLQQEQDEIDFYLRTNLRMKPLTPEEQKRHDDAVECEQCHKPFENTRAMRKVRHHLHLSGKYAMSVCSSCNLQLKPRVRREFREKYFFDDDDDNESQHRNDNFVNDWCEYDDPLQEGEFPGGIENGGNESGRAPAVTKGHFFIPVIAHNMKGYDAHIILKHLTKQFPDEQIQVIANNQEKYIAFDMGPFRFIDSLQFLGCSLDTLVSNLSRDGTSKFKLTRRFYRDDEKTLEILTRKGVYPYEFVTDRTKMAETCLPPKEKFYSHLSESHISDADYEHAKKVWAFFKMETFHEFHDRYLLTDVLLLADVFQNFRTMSLSNYGLDPLHYYTAPGLSWDSCLKMTGIRLELITDMEQMLFVEKGLRGGTSTITQRHAVANNPLVPNYDPTKESNYIIYLDCNNLYGHSQSQYLPYGGFSFLKQNNEGQFLNHENKIFDLNLCEAHDEIGYLLEVDLEYPAHLHMDHNDYPLAVEKCSVKKEDLSEYALHLVEKFGIKFSEEPKLIPNFRNKEKYVVHYRNLKFYLEKGLKLTAIHRIPPIFTEAVVGKVHRI